MDLKYAKKLHFVLHENMKRGEAHTCKHTISAKILANCTPYFTALQYINNLETKSSYKRKVNLKNIKLLKKSIERLINPNQTLLSSNQLELSL